MAADATHNEAAGRRRPYGGVSANVRRAQRRATLIAVALELMAEQGPGAVTLRNVCQRSKLNQRYFYESFATREELLVTAFDTARVEAQAAMNRATEDAAARGEEPFEVLRAAVDAFVGLMVDPPHHGEVLLVESQSEAVLRDRREQMVLAAADFIVEQTRRFAAGAIDETEARVVAVVIAGGTHDALAAWRRGALAVDREQLVDAVARQMARTLEVSPRADGSRSTR